MVHEQTMERWKCGTSEESWALWPEEWSRLGPGCCTGCQQVM